jgi:hypothetical protein
MVHCVSHLLDADLLGIEDDDRFFDPKAHIRSLHTLEPFQGFLDRDGSAASRHSFDREDDRRGHAERHVHGEREDKQERQR